MHFKGFYLEFKNTISTRHAWIGPSHFFEWKKTVCSLTFSVGFVRHDRVNRMSTMGNNKVPKCKGWGWRTTFSYRLLLVSLNTDIVLQKSWGWIESSIWDLTRVASWPPRILMATNFKNNFAKNSPASVFQLLGDMLFGHPVFSIWRLTNSPLIFNVSIFLVNVMFNATDSLELMVNNRVHWSPRCKSYQRKDL